MFPRDLLNNFRNSIREASKSQSKEILKPKRGKNTIEYDDTKQISAKVVKITKRLYAKPGSISESRDFFGNRSSLEEKDLNNRYKVP